VSQSLTSVQEPGAAASPGRTLIIMPAYNEAQNLPRVLAEVQSTLPGVDILVVNDASRDDTAALARAAGVQVLNLPCNLGYGGAVQTGFRYALEQGYDLAVMLDADGQHDPHSVPALLEPVAAGRADAAIGSRFLGKLEYRVGWVRRLGMALFGRIVALITGWLVTDPTSGFQALNRRVLAYFAQDNYPSDYPDADTLLMMHYAGFRVVEVPVTMRQRLAGVSMHGSWKAVYYIFKMLLSIFIVCLRAGDRAARCTPPAGSTDG
jgi:glycosyltransferase involved in cell wall biosynthesis